MKEDREHDRFLDGDRPLERYRILGGDQLSWLWLSVEVSDLYCDLLDRDLPDGEFISDP